MSKHTQQAVVGNGEGMKTYVVLFADALRRAPVAPHG